MITLGIVDDDPMVRTGLRLILGGETDLAVAWQAAEGGEALANLDEAEVDVLLLEVTSTLIAVATLAPAAAPASEALDALTERERDVAALMADGLTNAQIASRLHVSLASVKAHLTHVFTKLGVDNRVSAAMAVRGR